MALLSKCLGKSGSTVPLFAEGTWGWKEVAEWWDEGLLWGRKSQQKATWPQEGLTERTSLTPPAGLTHQHMRRGTQRYTSGTIPQVILRHTKIRDSFRMTKSKEPTEQTVWMVSKTFIWYLSLWQIALSSIPLFSYTQLIPLQDFFIHS